MSYGDFWAVDFGPLVCVLLSAICCNIGGTLLLARDQSMTVDAVSHIVLPGMVVAFLISGDINFFNIFWGALGASLAGIWFVEVLSKRHDRSAVLGMIFSVWFALGILLLELFVDNRVHFDVNHILFGSLESIYWLGLRGEDKFNLGVAIANMPADIPILLALLGGSMFLFVILYKEIVMVCFNYSYARCHIKYSYFVYYGISVFVTMTIVAAFKIIGLILILGMFIIPPLLASFFSGNLFSRNLLGMAFAVLICIIGYFAAVYVPAYYLGEKFSLNIGGTIVALGAIFSLIIVGVKQVIFSFSKKYDNINKISDI